MKMAALTLAASVAGLVSARDFRGVWVATVGNMDFPRSASAQVFKKNFSTIARGLSRRGCNAMIFQVRANCDAFYPSAFAPSSRWMSGVEGRGYGSFDPMRYMITEARRNGMEFHAWFNPYRVVRATKLSKSAYLSRLAPNNFARKHPEYVLAIPLGKEGISLMLDPGEPAVIEHVVQVVSEAARRYRPDAIHFDDYFYPYDGDSVPDDRTFYKYNPRKYSREDWRRNNVNQMVLLVKRAIDKINYGQKKPVRFGISPFGIWGNYSPRCPAGSRTKGKESYFVQYADTRLWIKNGWVDYIVPQIYWHRQHKLASFSTLLNWWCQVVRGTRVRLYIGHALYRFGTPGWGADELVNQLRLVRTRREVSGSVLFSSRYLLAPPNTATRRGITGVWR